MISTVTVALPPASTIAAGEAASINSGAVLTDWRVKVRVAIGSFENLPIPRRLVMTPCGEVGEFDSENSAPSSVPASQGYRFNTREASQSP